VRGADVKERKELYKCPHFRILVIGRANAGKTTILEKVCGVAKGTQPIIIYDENGQFNNNY
jgi:GTPase SAR1 family protein